LSSRTPARSAARGCPSGACSQSRASFSSKESATWSEFRMPG
jgi:hypothetical protein